MKRLILFSMMCLVAIASTAQDISGRVIDEQAQPMPFANVVLVSRADSAFIAGAVTKDDGSFSIATDKQDGLLKVSCVGFIIRYIDARQGNVGDIQMQPDNQTLGEVVDAAPFKDISLGPMGRFPKKERPTVQDFRLSAFNQELTICLTRCEI